MTTLEPKLRRMRAKLMPIILSVKQAMVCTKRMIRLTAQKIAAAMYKHLALTLRGFMSIYRLSSLAESYL